jgi:hypothetical protein
MGLAVPHILSADNDREGRPQFCLIQGEFNLAPKAPDAIANRYEPFTFLINSTTPDKETALAEKAGGRPPFFG